MSSLVENVGRIISAHSRKSAHPRAHGPKIKQVPRTVNRINRVLQFSSVTKYADIQKKPHKFPIMLQNMTYNKVSQFFSVTNSDNIKTSHTNL